MSLDLRCLFSYSFSGKPSLHGHNLREREGGGGGGRGGISLREVLPPLTTPLWSCMHRMRSGKKK